MCVIKSTIKKRQNTLTNLIPKYRNFIIEIARFGVKSNTLDKLFFKITNIFGNFTN